jgi:hypothetical protein
MLRAIALLLALPAKIHEVEALLKIFDGRVVYRSESSFE